MKILHVFPLSEKPSGIVSVVSNISSEILKRGDEIGWLSSIGIDIAKKYSVPDGVAFLGTTDRTSGMGSLLPGGNWSIPAWGWPKELPDVVHFHGIYLPPQARIARSCFREGIPYIVTPHGTFMVEAQKYRWLKKALANKLLFFGYLRKAASIHALGPEEAKAIKRVFPRAKISVIPNGIREDSLTSTKLLESRNEKRGTIFLFLGRLDVHHKGLDMLIKGVRNSAAVFRKSKSKMLLIGSFDSKRDMLALTKRITRWSLNDIVNIEGPKYGREKEASILSNDVFVHTSRYEGLPISVLEAMALGKPCLVTPGTNLASVIDEYDAGWTTDLDPDRIADTIIRIIKSSSNELNSKGIRAKKLIKERFLLSKTAESIRAMYREVIANNTIYARQGKQS